MKPKTSQSEECQLELGKALLDSFIDMKNPLVCLGKAIDWDHFCKKFGKSFHISQGRPGLPIRLMTGLTYLKHLYNLSDEKTVKQLLDSPYWQHFCGFIYFQNTAPLEPSSLTRFRDRLGEEGAEELLKQTIATAKRAGLLKKEDLRKVIIDTTIQEKNISYPTDGKLINKAREKLVKKAKKENIALRQSYKFKGKREKAQSDRYFHAKQYKRARASLKKQKTWLGRVIRDIKRKCSEPSEKMREALKLSQRVLDQERTSKDKIYSLHEPQTGCLSKGKAHKPYEFGNKVSFTLTGRGNWIIGAKSFLKNPFDGKTIKEAIKQTENLTGLEVRKIAVDRGYRGRVYHPEGKETVIAGTRAKDRGMRRFLKRRSAIEPVTGHMKQEHRLGVNYLGGVKGDKINPILAASAFNMQKLLKAFVAPFLDWLKKRMFFAFSSL